MDYALIILGLASLGMLVMALAFIFYMVRMHRPNEDFKAIVARSHDAWRGKGRETEKVLQESAKERN